MNFNINLQNFKCIFKDECFKINENNFIFQKDLFYKINYRHFNSTILKINNIIIKNLHYIKSHKAFCLSLCNFACLMNYNNCFHLIYGNIKTIKIVLAKELANSLTCNYKYDFGIENLIFTIISINAVSNMFNAYECMKVYKYIYSSHFRNAVL